jgi:hypothetical protein
MKQVQLKRWAYRLKGNFHVLGPFCAKNKKEAGLIIKKTRRFLCQ